MIPVRDRRRQRISIFENPPIPYFRLNKKIQTLPRVIDPMSQIATLLPEAKSALEARIVITAITNRVVLCGLASPLKIATA